MLTLDKLIELIQQLEVQGIFTSVQSNKLITAATSMLTTFASQEEYVAKYNLFLALLGGKWL